MLCSWGKQVWVLYRQALLAQLRNPSDTAGRIYVTVLINLLVSKAACMGSMQLSAASRLPTLRCINVSAVRYPVQAYSMHGLLTAACALEGHVHQQRMPWLALNDSKRPGACCILPA